MAKQGKKQDWHFSHISGTQCKSEKEINLSILDKLVSIELKSMLVSPSISSVDEVICPLFSTDEKDFNLISNELCQYCIFNHKIDGCGGQSYIAEIDDLYISKEQRYQKYESEINNLKIIKTKLDIKRQKSNRK